MFVVTPFCCSTSLIPCGKLGMPYTVRLQQLQERCNSFLPVCAVFSCVQTMVPLPVRGILNTHADVEACNCTQGCIIAVIVCIKSWLGEKSHAWNFGLMLYRLSYPMSHVHMTIMYIVSNSVASFPVGTKIGNPMEVKVLSCHHNFALRHHSLKTTVVSHYIARTHTHTKLNFDN